LTKEKTKTLSQAKKSIFDFIEKKVHRRKRRKRTFLREKIRSSKKGGSTLATSRVNLEGKKLLWSPPKPEIDSMRALSRDLSVDERK